MSFYQKDIVSKLLQLIKARGCGGKMPPMIILGGSFNPAHFGHLFVSQQARKIFFHHNCKQVFWLPSFENPLKKGDKASYKSAYFK